MKNNKGFTLIELMIVIAIIAIIAAIAIPNLMASRIRANEATAIAAIKQIATAQVTYQAGRQGRTGQTTGGNNGYCDNYRNLAFAEPMGGTAGTDKLALVSDVVANASLTANGGGGTSTQAAPGSTGGFEPYQGYLFENDPTITAAAAGGIAWASDFACYGTPSFDGTTGNNAYWVGQQGTVYIDGRPDATTALAAPGSVYTATNTPQNGPTGTWSTL